MTKNHFMYFLNSNGEYKSDSTIERDHHENFFNKGDLELDEKREAIDYDNYSIPNYPLRQYLDEHVANKIWKANGVNHQSNEKEWNDGFTKSMKSSKWNDHQLDNYTGTNWGEYTQRKNPWV